MVQQGRQWRRPALLERGAEGAGVGRGEGVGHGGQPSVTRPREDTQGGQRWGDFLWFPPLVALRESFPRQVDRKARGLQMEEIACKCQTFLSLLSGKRKQTSNIFSFSIQI